VVIDRDTGAAYVSEPAGSLAAVDLASGSRRWETEGAALPLGFVDDRLVALGEPSNGALRLIGFEPERGVRSVTVEAGLPAGVRAQLADSLGRRFRAALINGEGGALLAWQAESRVSSAVGPLRGLASARSGDDSISRHSGVFRVEGAQLGLIPLGAGMAPVLADSRLEELTTDRAEGLVAFREFLSADGANRLRSEELTVESGPPQFRWTITDAAGRVMGGLVSEVAAAPFVVVGDTLLWVRPAAGKRVDGRWREVPRAVSAYHLGYGTQLWEQAVRDLIYRGPQPP
jgi:hypothetical protein